MAISTIVPIIMFLVVFAMLFGSLNAEIPHEGLKFIGTYESTNYYVTKEKRNWENSFNFCKEKAKRAGGLLSLETKAESDKVIGHLIAFNNKIDRIWISGKCDECKQANQNWNWGTTETKFDYKNWGHGEPLNIESGYKVALLIQYPPAWATKPRTEDYYSICEIRD